MKLLNLALFLAGIVVIAVVANGFAAMGGLRVRVDATKTRAYSLSAQTNLTLDRIEGEWTIAVVSSRSAVDPALRRQVDEVLDRFADSPDVSVVRIDPEDPSTLDRYEWLLSHLRASYAEPIADYDRAVADGRAATESFQVMLQQQTGLLRTLVERLQADDVNRRATVQLLQVFSVRVEQAAAVIEEVDRALRVDDQRPLPDYEAARSVLSAALSAWAEEQLRIAQLLRGWTETGGEPLLRQFGANQRRVFEGQAQSLALVADPLKHLPPLELGRIGRALEQGEAAIVMGPEGAAVIPSAQLFPSLALRAEAGQITYDQRFRGEQMISATIRSLMVDRMPLVVFVHAQNESLLTPRDRNVDLFGAASVLAASRFEVAEWIVGQSEPPTPEPGQPVVWIVVPPPSREGLEPTAGEVELIDTARTLLADGESVLLSIYPSALTKFGRPDPWQGVADAFGLRAETGAVVFERVRRSPQEVVRQKGQMLRDFSSGHPIAAALHGQQTHLSLPIAIVQADAPPPGARIDVIAEITPSSDRWLEAEWAVDAPVGDGAAPSEPLTGPVPVIVAVENRHRLRDDPQRVIVVGSGGWMLSFIADAAVSLGGDRVVRQQPGNYELLLASVAWLAGMDDLIAPSAVSQLVTRLDGISPEVRSRWRWIALVLAPAACGLAGLAVFTLRRRP